MMIWSTEQNAIIRWFETGRGNLVVNAGAGCGKSTTLAEGIKRAPEARKWVGAFGKKNKEDLEPRFVGTNVKVQTFHSLGASYVYSRWPGMRMCIGKERAKALVTRIVPSTAPDDVKKLVCELHTKAREIQPHARTAEELIDLAYEFELTPDDDWVDEFPVETLCLYAVRCMELAATERPDATGIDFADMIFLPVRNRWMRPRFDLMVADECQDLTVAQLELALGSLSKTGRFCAVGDNRQAIYAFRGADCESLDRLKKELNATELALMTTRRCCQSVVREAQKIVPNFVAHEENPEGEVKALAAGKLLDTVGYGDFILSRANAPLLTYAMKLLKAGRRARIAGKNIGDGLKAIVRKLAKNDARNSVPALIGRLGAWRDREIARALKIDNEDRREVRVNFIDDQFEMLQNLAQEAVSVGAIEANIDALFTDNGLGDAGVVTLSSVHRAKGLEADKVFLLADTFRSGSEEEDNIRYVAITRAKKELTWVA